LTRPLRRRKIGGSRERVIVAGILS